MIWTAEQWKAGRQKGRTNLIWFCRNVLGYRDVSREVHGPILDALQKFQGGEEIVHQKADSFELVQNSYKPACPIYALEWPHEGERQNLILYPRGHLKTTIVTFAHSIQWIINYPDIAIDLHTAIDKQGYEFIAEVKKHFISNEIFRFYYPEFCPKFKGRIGKVEDFGNQECFTIPNRTFEGRQPTFSRFTVGSTIASGHYDVTKCDDLVDKENVRTPEQIQVVKSHFSMIDPLIQRYSKPEDWPADKPWMGRAWLDLTGTIYDFSDLHFSTLEAEKEKPVDKKSWHVVCVNPAPNYPEGPTLWESRWPVEEFKKIENDPTKGPAMLYSQYFLNPIPSNSGLVDNENQIRWIPRKDLDGLLARLTQHITIDLAGMEPSTNKLADNDFTVINHHGFGQDGRLYINRLWRGRYTPFEVIDLIFKISSLYPKIMDYKVSKDHFARVLLPFLRREMQRRSKFLPVTEIAISNRISKQQKIKGLQPWFRNGSIVWAGDIECKHAVINEIMRFPKYSHDDILDTTADALEGFDGEVTADVYGRPKTQMEVQMQDSPFPAALTWSMLEQEQKEEDGQHCSLTGW